MRVFLPGSGNQDQEARNSPETGIRVRSEIWRAGGRNGRHPAYSASYRKKARISPKKQHPSLNAACIRGKSLLSKP